MKTVQISELSGAALDWAVAQTFKPGAYWESKEFLDSFHPSTDWADGGPIIEREGITVSCAWDKSPQEMGEQLKPWVACMSNTMRFVQYGPTPLIAAMRCYVASKLGNEMEIPDELAV